MSKLIAIIYDELGVVMLLFSLMMVPFLVIVGACLAAHAMLHWWPW